MRGFGDQFSQDTIRAAAERPREVIDADNMTPAQIREAWPELRHYLADACTAILIGSLESMRYDPEARADRFARIKAARELCSEMQTVRPR